MSDDIHGNNKPTPGSDDKHVISGRRKWFTKACAEHSSSLMISGAQFDNSVLSLF